MFGDRPVSEVDTALVMKVLAPIWSTKPDRANRVRGRIEVVLDAAKTQEQRSGENPAPWRGHLANLLPSKRKVRRVRHHPALPYAEVPSFMAALRRHPSLSARALEFCISTGVRCNEAAGAHWREIDLDAAIWQIPPGRMKAARLHRVPLVGRALEILKDMHGPNGWVFPGRIENSPISVSAFNKMLGLMGDWRDEVGDSITIHGMRSSLPRLGGRVHGVPARGRRDGAGSRRRRRNRARIRTQQSVRQTPPADGGLGSVLPEGPKDMTDTTSWLSVPAVNRSSMPHQ
jgi:integrase